MHVKTWVVVVGLQLGAVAAAWAVPPHGPTSTVAAIARMSRPEASRHLPVSVEAVVTYFRSYDHVLFVQDGAAAIYVNATTSLNLRPGDRVLVRGITHDSFRNYVESKEIVFLRHGPLPLPAEAGYREMIRGGVDCRLVRVRAVVRSAEIVPSSTRLIPATALRLLVEGEQVDAEVGGSDAAALPGLLDAEVEITGVVSGHFDNKMQQTGVLLHVGSLRDLRVLHRSTADPWSLAVTPMDRVVTHYSILDRTERTRVRGTITYSLPGSGAVLQDGTRSLWITTDSFQPLRVGDLADATGFPDVKNGFLSLTRSDVRDRLIPAPVAAPLYTWRALAEGGNSSHGHLYDLVSMEGQVVAEVRQATQDEYILSADGHLTSAIYRHPGSLVHVAVPAMRGIPVGSKVRVTGICMLTDADPFLGDVPFNLLLRSYDDITVMASPPWLNVRHLIYLIAVLAACMFLVVARSWRMERRMRQQTADMAAVESRRSRILEAMNAGESQDAILHEICELVSFQLQGAPCWCELSNGARAGWKPDRMAENRVAHCPVVAGSGAMLGTLFAAGDHGEKTTAVLWRGAELIVLETEKSRLHADLVYRSEFDLLTEIHNRFSMERSIDALIDAAQHTRGIFGLIYADLDGFKAVNDRNGHGVGDRYLQAVALRLKGQLRSGDTLARLGGDEFAVSVTQVQSRAEVEAIARRLQHCFDDPFTIDTIVIAGRASVGFAVYPEDGATRDDLLNAADREMYTQKRARAELRPRLVTRR